jgi:O-acetylserine/cysteine efflux transporter
VLTQRGLRPIHAVQAVLVAVIWWLAFIATRVALDDFSPPQLTALRFIIAALPALWLPRPPVPWRTLIAGGLTLFTGQFLLQFFGIRYGAPVGVAAVVVHTQAFFTVLLSAALLGERPSGRQWAGMALAAAGLALIALSAGGDLRLLGLGLTLGSALSWAAGNLLLKRVGQVQMLPLVVWLSLVPPLPALALSLVWDGPAALAHALPSASWPALAAVLYLGTLSTHLGYAWWGQLLRRYPTAQVAPFALLAPVVGSAASALLLGERFGPLRLAGMLAILAGLGLSVLPWSGLRHWAGRWARK